MTRMLKQSSLIHGPIAKTLIKLSVPIIISNLLQAAYLIVDRYWLGRHSRDAIEVITLNFPFNVVLISLAGGLPIVGGVYVAQFRGRGDERSVSHVTAQTILLAVVIAVLLTAAVLPFARPLMEVMGARDAVLADAVLFLQISLAGFVFVFAFLAYQSLVRGVGIVQRPMLIVGLTVLLNFFLDPMFIFGWGPIPAMGAAGAALATVCSQGVAAIIGFSLLLGGRHGIHLHWCDFRPDFVFIRQLFRLGLPTSVEQSTQAVGFWVMTKLVNHFGPVTVAAYGIGTAVVLVLLIPAMGLCMATSTLVGQNLGAGYLDRAVRTNKIACLIAVVALLAGGLVLYVAAEPLTWLLMEKGGELAIGESVVFIRTVSFTFWCIGVQQVLFGTLRGAGNTVAPMVLAIILLWCLRFPLALFLSLRTDLQSEGIWWAFAATNVLAAAITGLWFLRGDWKRRRLLDDAELEPEICEEVSVREGTPF
jgi:putative MATE family efflux protein